MSKLTRFRLSIENEQADAGRDGEPVPRDQILRREQGLQGNVHFPCSADNEQDWQPYPVVCPFAPENLTSRDRFDLPIPRQPPHPG